MEKLTNIHDLLINQLRDLYDAEDQQFIHLSKIKSAVSSMVLNDMLEYYRRELQKHLRRLERIFTIMNKDPEGKKSMAMEGLIKEAHSLIDRCTEGEVLDAGLATSIQHINHYEIAGYGTAISYAKALEKHDLATSLLETLRDRKQFDLELSNLTDESLNEQAANNTTINENQNSNYE